VGRWLRQESKGPRQGDGGLSFLTVDTGVNEEFAGTGGVPHLERDTL
jgi:hypothetical protein